MPAYLLLLLAVASRLIPHAGWFNFTAAGGSLLYFGARRPAREMAIPLAAFIATDYVLTVFFYHYSFQPQGYVITWLWYAWAMVLGSLLLKARVSTVRVGAAALLGPTSFFAVSNFAVWAGGGMYPQTMGGLGACYVAALPFYRNDVLSTTLVLGLAFGLPALVRRTLDAQAAPAANGTVR